MVWEGRWTASAEHPQPPRGCTLPCQGAAGGTRWAGRRRKEHSFPCADGPRRAPAAPGPAPAPPPPFRKVILAGGGPVPGQVESWLWPWARSSVSWEEFFPLLSWAECLDALLRAWEQEFFSATTTVTTSDFSESGWLLWLGEPAL